jgi:hypothetical protein
LSFKTSFPKLPERLNCFNLLVTCYCSFVALRGFKIMAFAGHKFAQTPHRVQDTTSTIWGLPSAPASKTPKGQTPMQISVEQGGHLV